MIGGQWQMIWIDICLHVYIVVSDFDIIVVILWYLYRLELLQFGENLIKSLIHLILTCDFKS